MTFTATVSASAPGSGTPTGIITFYDGSNPIGTETLSGGTASYSTSALPAGDHSITAQFGGSADFAVSNSTAITQMVTAAAPATLDGEVYNDRTGNGTLAADEGLAGWTVDLKHGTATVATTTTAADGTYTFAGVTAGAYTIAVVEQTGYVPSVPASGTLAVTASAGQIVGNLDLGEFQTVTVTGEVFNDLNDSGTLQTNDPGLAGWTVNLLNSLSQVVQTATSGFGGNFAFSGVGPGTYTISDELQPGFVQTAPTSGGLSITTTSGANISGENLGIAQGASLAVTGLVIMPATSLQSGTSLVVFWDDTNGGNFPIAASFTDQVTITDLTTGQVLGVADVPFDVSTRGRISAGASALQQYAFRLPDGDPGVGNIEFSVTADEYDAISGGLSAANRTASITATSTLAQYADLVPSGLSAPASATPGESVTISWTDCNLGDATAVAPWSDEILLSYDGTTANAIPVGSIEVNSSIAAGHSFALSTTVMIPVSGADSAGSLQFVVIDNANSSFFELNRANNTTIDATATVVPLALTVTSPTLSIAENATDPTILAVVTRSGPTDQALVVNLASADTTGFTAPASVTIEAGQTTMPIPITIHDDGIVDADRAITITASATGYLAGQATITDINTDESSLSVSFSTRRRPWPREATSQQR